MPKLKILKVDHKTIYPVTISRAIVHGNKTTDKVLNEMSASISNINDVLDNINPIDSQTITNLFEQ